MAPKGKADYAFLLHDLYHVSPDGIMTIVLPHGVLFRGGEEGEIRKNLIEKNQIDAIIGLPANIFFGTGIPTIIMVLKQNRDTDEVLIIDASKGFEKEGKNNKLRACDIRKIADVVAGRVEIEKFSRKISREEIRNNDYNLNIPRYVDSSEKAESFDIYAMMFGGIPNSEIDEYEKYWSAFCGLREKLFTRENDSYSEIKVSDIRETINKHESVNAFIDKFNQTFDGFEEYLYAELIENAETVVITREEAIISDNIFSRLKDMPLVDYYEAYQILDNNWIQVAGDLEIIQTEGFAATKIVDPKMVMKKKNGVDVEVQEGFVGRIIPFELIEKSILKSEYDLLKEKEQRLDEITSQFEELLDSLSEEEKSCDAVSEEGTSFVNAQVVKLAKQYVNDIKKGAVYQEESFEEKIIKCNKLISEEKELKKEVKAESDRLHLKTKETIEALSDDEVKVLLKQKWIAGIVESLSKIPTSIISSVSEAVNYLAKKYEDTFEDVEKEIAKTEKELVGLMDSLTANEFDMKGISELKSLLMGE